MADNFSQIPYAFFDNTMLLTDKEYRILMALVRYRYYKDEQVTVSMSKLMAMTNTKRKETIITTIRNLEKKGFINVQREDRKCNIYTIKDCG